VLEMRVAKEKREKVSLSLDPGLVSRLRAMYPGVPLSRAASHAIAAHLERSELEKRVRNLEVVCRAALMLLADMAARWDEREGGRLVHSYAQKAVALVRKMEGRLKRDAGEGAPLPEQTEGE